jgi:hypothetical protein
VKIADDEGVSPSSSVTHEFPVICFSPRVMFNILSTAVNYLFKKSIFGKNVKFDIYKNIF